MAIYHCSCQVIGRGAGRSAVAASAYRSGTKMTNEYNGETYDFTRKGGVEYSAVSLPNNAPKEYSDREKLWNAVELSESAKGRLAREFDIAIPREIETIEERIAFAKNLVKDIFVSRGMIADWAIHNKEVKDPNPHIHVTLPVRPLDISGSWVAKSQKVYICKNSKGEEREFTAEELSECEDETFEKQLPYYKNGNPKSKPVYLTKTEANTNPKYKNYSRVKGKNDPKKTKEDRVNPKMKYWDSVDCLKEIRQEVAEKINAELERLGCDERVSHLSLVEQGIDREPQVHIGVAASAMEKRGIETDRGNINREIKKANAEYEKEKAELQLEEEAVKAAYIPVYEYGLVDVQSIDTDCRVHYFSDKYEIVLRSEPERSIIADIKESDRELYGLIDTTRLQELLKRQKQGVPSKQREEILVQQIQEGFASLRFIEQNNICTIDQVKAGAAELQIKYDECVLQINEATKMLYRLENSDKQDLAIDGYKEKLNMLQGALSDIESKLMEHSVCIRTLERIDNEQRQQPKVIVPVTEKKPDVMMPNFGVLTTAYIELCEHTVSKYDTRQSLSPAVANAASNLRKEVNELKSAQEHLNQVNRMLIDCSKRKPGILQGKKAKDAWELEFREAVLARDVAEKQCQTIFDKIADYGVSTYRDGAKISPIYMNQEVWDYINDSVEYVAKNLEDKARDAAKYVRPADAPEYNPLAHREALERFIDLCREIPAEHKMAAREAIERVRGVGLNGDVMANAKAESVLQDIIRVELSARSARTNEKERSEHSSQGRSDAER